MTLPHVSPSPEMYPNLIMSSRNNDIEALITLGVVQLKFHSEYCNQ